MIGRMDKSAGGRKSASEMIEGLDSDKYMIMLDHQPSDYAAEAEAGADLVLSGHTHGGQMLPINKVGEWLGTNDFRRLSWVFLKRVYRFPFWRRT